MENCGSRAVSINDADFFGTPDRPKEVMRALKGRGLQWQAGVTSKLAQDDRMLELAAESGCTLLSIGFESISRSTLKSVHKHVNRPETFIALVEKVHSYGIMVFGLFMYGFDGDDRSVFEETVRFNRESDYDACAYSTLTPYPGTLTWYEMKKANRIVSFDWRNTTKATWCFVRRRCPATICASAKQRRIGLSIHCPRSRAGSQRRRAASRPMADLQYVHAPGREDGRTHRCYRTADTGARYCADAADPAHQARVAGRRA